LNGALNYEIIDNLKLRSELGYDTYNNDKDRFYGRTTYYVRNKPAALDQGFPAVIFTNTARNTFRNTNTLNYDFKKHLGSSQNLNLLVGQEYITARQKVLEATTHGFPMTFTFQDARKLSSQGHANS